MSREVLNRLAESLGSIDREVMLQSLRRALDEGAPTSEIISALAKGMDIVGGKFEAQEYFLVDLVTAADDMKEAMKLLEDRFQQDFDKLSQIGRVVIGTVEGDLHDLGKNIVIAYLEAAGFKVHDLGVDTPTSRFIEGVRRFDPDIVGMSALLATTMLRMKDVIDALDKIGLRRRVYVMIGGAPTSREFADEIGADVHCKDAVEAVAVARRYVDSKVR